MELVLTIASIAAVSGLAALGIAALPWTEGEVRESLDAVEALPKLVNPGLGGAGLVSVGVRVGITR